MFWRGMCMPPVWRVGECAWEYQCSTTQQQKPHTCPPVQQDVDEEVQANDVSKHNQAAHGVVPQHIHNLRASGQANGRGALPSVE